MSYKCGIDTATTGAICITCGDKIIDVIKFPEREYNKGREKIIKSTIQYLETQPRSATKIKTLKAELKALKRRADRDYKSLYDFMFKYKDKIEYVILEEPIRQSVLGTSIDAIFANALTLGVYQTICSILEIPVRLYSPKDWHKFYEYDSQIGKCLSNKEKREKIKELSIKICREKFINADDFIMLPRHKNADDNIAEASILSLIEEFED